MMDEEFAERLSAMLEPMFHISCSQLRNACDRDDAVQEALCKAWNSRKKLKNEQYMKTWVIRILINECHNIQRKHKREIVTDEQPEGIDSNNTNEELYDALFRLDAKLRLPIVLHYIEGYHVQEIAKILGTPKGTILWRMAKARKELKIMLDADICSEES